MQQIDLFSGICGFAIAAEALGVKTAVFCEIQPFPRAVTAARFPGIPIHGDIRTLTYQKLVEYGWNPSEPTIVTGGFPCQPFSVAGKRKGENDDRYLWPEMLRVISEAKPEWVVGENVGGFASMDINTGLHEVADSESTLVLFKKVAQQVIDDLSSVGYELACTDRGEPVLFIIPAAAINAPHRRDRVWIVARRAAKDSNGAANGKLQEQGYFWELWNASTGGNERHPAEKAFGYASNTSNPGLEGLPKQKDSTHQPVNTTYSDIGKLQGRGSPGYAEEEGEKSKEQPIRFHKFDYWTSFPAESPVYVGNDGLRAELVRLGCKNPDRVVRYQREQAIKSAGNAIVPWVYYEILKVILQLSRIA